MGLIRWLGALIGSALSLVLFLLMPWRWFRRRQPVAGIVPTPEMAAPVEAEPAWPQMPRTGRPGTATDDQVEALMEARIVPAPPCRDLHDYSVEEAAAILDALAFSRAVAAQVTGGEDADAPPEVLTELLNDLVATTLADDELRDFALRWARSGQPLPIRENTTFARAREAVLRHWQPAEA
ncbi:hypothetical protein [Elioraea rosea]|uniref:hypothetical protein n=1 Tax=Elioraea rosea TaxID=2492390 RepID=UPI0011839492|nr:hypothetical protein [Elioraea rosea]